MNLKIHTSWHRLLEQRVDYRQCLTAVTATELIMERQPQSRTASLIQVRPDISGGSRLTRIVK